MKWFDVDKAGLAKILERRGVCFALWELVSNGLDAPGVTVVTVNLEPIERSPFTRITVEDDSPEGFRDLSHAWTLYAESCRKGDAEKRGRFNLGEKLVLSLCREATISTTTGTVRFDDDGRHVSSKKRERGSVFSAEIRMAREQMIDALVELRKLLPPPGVEVTINGDAIAHRDPIACVEDTLATELAGEDGTIRRTARKATVEFYDVAEGEVAMVYELGIPVVETGDRYHANVMQKVPLSTDRDNVPPSFLRHLRTLCLNVVSSRITAEEARAPWVREALEDHRVVGDAVRNVVTAQYGDKRIAQDPSDREGEKIGISKGYTMVPGGAFSKAAWENIRKAEAVLPAGKVTPSPKPFSANGTPLKVTPPELWTIAMKLRVAWIQEFAERLIGHTVSVVLTPDVGWGFAGCYGRQSQELTINYGRLGRKWFEAEKDDPKVLEFLYHEFAHDKVSDHLCNEFHDEVGRLGARGTRIAVRYPSLFK